MALSAHACQRLKAILNGYVYYSSLSLHVRAASVTQHSAATTGWRRGWLAPSLQACTGVRIQAHMPWQEGPPQEQGLSMHAYCLFNASCEDICPDRLQHGMSAYSTSNTCM